MELEQKLSTENIHSRLDRERMEVRKSVDVSTLSLLTGYSYDVVAIFFNFWQPARLESPPFSH